MIDTPHYVRFTRALALAATLALPACSSESTSPGDVDASTTGATDPVGTVRPVTPPAQDAGVPMVADAAPAPVDGGEPEDAGGSPSGPLAPPELPASFA